jgi:acyl carrier protein
MEHTLEPELVERKIVTLVARNLKVDEARVALDTSLIEELGADSLDALTIALDVDREFGIKVDDSEVGSFRTCREIASAVVRHLKTQTLAVA